jgi:hypothetical protein
MEKNKKNKKAPKGVKIKKNDFESLITGGKINEIDTPPIGVLNSIDVIKQLFERATSPINYTGFCSTCGDMALSPLVISVKTISGEELKLPVSLCKKCGAIVTNIDMFRSFLRAVTASLGADFNPQQ